MRIGIDLDNTIICYDDAFSSVAREKGLVGIDFSGSKAKVRKMVRRSPDGEKNWQLIQGEVYGSSISRARIYCGVSRFLWRCRVRGFDVEIVSHKTKIGHSDPSRTLLREAASGFLKQHKIIDERSGVSASRVTYFDTRDEKIHYIEQERFDWFIDDLPEVLDHPKIPSSTKKIGFSPDLATKFATASRVRSWGQIESEILGLWSGEELSLAAEIIAGERPVEITWLGGRSNSGIAKATWRRTGVTALKIYATDDHHDRYSSEQQGLKFLRQCGETRIPQALGGIRELGVGLITWLPGKLVNEPSLHDLELLLNFLERIHGFREDARFSSFPSASASVFSGRELERQVSERLHLLRSYSLDSPDLHQFLDDEFVPTFSVVRDWAETNWKGERFDARLENEKRTLSPSDLGFHNCLKTKEGEIEVIDFEYFGWDDPTKLCADFLFHPGMNLSDSLKRQWVHGIERIYGDWVLERLISMWGLIGLVWSLILLNGFRLDHRARRDIAVGKLDVARLHTLKSQLDSSRKLVRQVQSEYKHPRFPF